MTRNRNTRLGLWALAAVGVLTLGALQCNVSRADDKVISFSRVWSGVINNNFPLTLTLKQTGDTFTGGGQVSFPGPNPVPTRFTLIEGKVKDRTLTFKVLPVKGSRIQYSGTEQLVLLGDGKTIQGTLGGFPAVAGYAGQIDSDGGITRLVSNDFNKDGHADILWHNDLTGESQIWYMSGSSRIGRATIVDENSKSIFIGVWNDPWSIAGSRDFNGDGNTDILCHNGDTGEIQIWQLNGNKIIGRPDVGGEDGKPIFITRPWYIDGANDFNGDGNTDLLCNKVKTGETQIWFMKGNKISGRATVLDENGQPLLLVTPPRIVSTNDFDGDGHTDIVWYNPATHETQIWFMNERKVISRSTVTDEHDKAIFIGAPWYIVGTNDFDRDGAADILWHNNDTGETQIWFMKGHSIVRRATVDADRDGGGALVKSPWDVMNH